MKKIVTVFVAMFVGIVSLSLFSCDDKDEHFGWKYIGNYDTMRECYAAVIEAGFTAASLEGKSCYGQ